MNNLMLAVWLGMSFIFLTEGLMLTLSPKMWKETIKQIIARPVEVLQKIGFSMGCVAVAMAAIWHFYPQTLGISWLGFAMMAMMEGLMLGVFPHYWQKRVLTFVAMSEPKLRQIGISLLISGGFIFVSSHI